MPKLVAEGISKEKFNQLMLENNPPPAHEQKATSPTTFSHLKTIASCASMGHFKLELTSANSSPKSETHEASLGENDLNGHDEERGHGPKVPFVKSHGLTTAQANELELKWGKNELEEKSVPKWYIFVSQLWQPMPLMIWIAAIVEAAIQNWLDCGILLAIQFMNASLSYYEFTKAGDSIAALKASLKPLAHVRRDGQVIEIDAADLVPGDCIVLVSGGAVPADCTINEGQIDVDQAALTGESLPAVMHEGDEAKMGSTVVRGETEATVTSTGMHTFLGKTASMLSGPPEMSNLQKVLIKIMIILVVASLTLCAITFTFLIKSGEDLTSALSFTVVLLVASIPIAIEIVCTTTLALGSHQLAQDGAIVSRLAAIEDLAGMTILCSDKTGTLTLNKMVIQEETPVYVEGENQYSLLRYAAMAAKWKEPAKDALDTLVFGSVDMASMDTVTQLDFMPFDPAVKRTEGTVEEKGKTFKTTKGAPNVILKLCKQTCTPEIMKKCEADVQSLGKRGVRAMGIAKTNEEGNWVMVGLLSFLDPPRPDTKETIRKAVEYGVAVKMITGDHVLIAKETARVLDMGLNIQTPEKLPMLKDGVAPPDLLKYANVVLPADGFAQVFPEHKFLVVETLRRLGHKVGMTGDGVNDAPALKQADVGVAVQGATDAARGVADIVLTQPGLSTIVDAILIARMIFQRMKNFLTYRIAATIQLLLFFFIAVLSMEPKTYLPSDVPKDIRDGYPAFFNMPVLMLMLITLLNDGTLISVGYDTVVPSPLPQRWNLPVLFTVSFALAAVACLSSLVLLHFALDSWNHDGPFYHLGLHELSYGQITTMIYLKVSVSDFLTLFSARTEGPFWSTAPSNILLVAAAVALSISTILATVWPSSHPDGIYTIGLERANPKAMSAFIWVYCLLVWMIQDAVKVLVIKILKKNNYLGFNDTANQAIERSSHFKKNSQQPPQIAVKK